MFSKLVSGLRRTKGNFTEKITGLFKGKNELDSSVLHELEKHLISSDLGVKTTKELIDNLKKKLQKDMLSSEDVLSSLKEQLLDDLLQRERHLTIEKNGSPYVILVVGVNGSGKTTTIGKLAKLLQKDGKKVMLAAADTFRAAACEQLRIWGERNGVPVISQHAGADSAAVAFDALNAARARDIDVLIVDTAGRLHTQSNLMDELKKIKKVLKKVTQGAPDEVLLVLDAGIGQNALNQAREFNDAVGVTGIVLTKLDGTAKGGIIFSIVKELQLPLCFIGIGEGIDDLQPFNSREFINVLFD